MKRRGVVVAGSAMGLLFVVAILGPRVRVEVSWSEPALGEDVVGYLQAAEAAVPRIRPGEERAVVWADSETRAPTPLSIVYLHGFSADRHEVEPLVSDLAVALGANTYYARLRGHGRDGAAMGELTGEGLLADAAEAVRIGERIGERVILVGTSTGGTLATWVASRAEARTRVAALVLISPNFQVKDPLAGVMLWPWGRLMARIALGRERCFQAVDEAQEAHWTTCYPTAALPRMMALTALVDRGMVHEVEAPLFIGYSPRDRAVEARRTQRLFPWFGSARKTLRVVPSSDPEQHVLVGDMIAPEATAPLEAWILDFLLPLLPPEGVG